METEREKEESMHACMNRHMYASNSREKRMQGQRASRNNCLASADTDKHELVLAVTLRIDLNNGHKCQYSKTEASLARP